MDIKDFFIEPEKHPLPELSKKLASKDNFKVLDVGCQIPLIFFILYHDFDIHNFLGIDLASEKKALRRHLIKNSGHINANIQVDDYSIFEIYKKVCEPDHTSINAKITAVQEFNRIFKDKIMFNTDLFQYLKQSKDKFDLIIASNIIHLLDNEDLIHEALTGIKARLNPDGVVYFRTEFRNKSTYDYFKNHVKEVFGINTLKEEIRDGNPVSFYYNLDF